VTTLVLSVLLAGVLASWLRFAVVLWGRRKLPNRARASHASPTGGWPKLWRDTRHDLGELRAHYVREGDWPHAHRFIALFKRGGIRSGREVAAAVPGFGLRLSPGG
jgi:hypothetical protein